MGRLRRAVANAPWALVLTGCVTLDKSRSLSEPLFPFPYNEITGGDDFTDSVKCLLLKRLPTHAESATSPLTISNFSFVLFCFVFSFSAHGRS